VTVEKKEYHKRSILINKGDGFVLDGENGTINSGKCDKATQQRILSIPGFDKEERITEEVWVGQLAGNILLKDTLSPFKGFSTIPAYATKRGQKIKGKVFDLIQLQQEMNKIRSLYVEQLMKGTNPVYIAEADAFKDDRQMDEFRENRATPGAVLEVASREKLTLMEGVTPAQQLFQMMERFNADIKEVSGINEEMMGSQSNATSTPLYLERRNSAILSNEFLFENLNTADRQLTFRMMEAYQLLKPEIVFRILKNTDQRQEQEGGLTLGSTPLAEYSEADILELWNRLDMAKYDVAIGFGDNSPTKRLSDYKMWVELAKQGVEGVTGIFLIERSDLPPKDKERLLAIMRENSQIQQQLEAKRLSIEENKTKIANEYSMVRSREEIASNERIELAKLMQNQGKLDQDALLNLYKMQTPGGEKATQTA